MATSSVNRLILQDIRLVWDAIQPNIAKLQKDHDFSWRPEDIYAQCLMGRAFCYVCKDGFLIVKPQENQFTLAKELYVWICYSVATDGMIEYRLDINELAKDIYATSIIFESPREGFKHLAKNHRWRSMTNYTVPVT